MISINWVRLSNPQILLHISMLILRKSKLCGTNFFSVLALPIYYKIGSLPHSRPGIEFNNPDFRIPGHNLNKHEHIFSILIKKLLLEYLDLLFLQFNTSCNKLQSFYFHINYPISKIVDHVQESRCRGITCLI